MAGPPDDFKNDPTRYRGGGRPADEPPPPVPAEPQLDPFGEEAEPTPWYRKPVGLIIWGLSVLILIALIVYGIIQLVGDQGGTGNPKTTTTTPSTTTTTVTPTTTSPTPTTATTTESPTSSAIQSPEPQPTHQPTQQEPTRRHHWPSWLPTTIPPIP